MDTTDRITEAEYLVRERAAEYRSEYLDGRIRALAGASDTHIFIVASLVALLWPQLRRGPCRVGSSDMRVKVSATGLYTYPDVVIVCGRAQMEDEHADTLLNPVVILEVLSPSTEAYDRGEKFAHYRRLDSLREYVLVAQDRMRVEHFARERNWAPVTLEAPDSVMALATIGCALPLADIYERIELKR